MQNHNIKAPEEITNFLNEIVDNFQKYFADNLVGVYLHGSLAMGCFNPVSSDIDIQVVVKNNLSKEEKENILNLTKSALEKIPTKKVELSFVTIDTLTDFKCPTPQEFNISGTASSGLKTTDKKPSESFAAHLAMIKEHGVCLWGEPIMNIFPDISREIYLKSIAENFKWSFDNVSKGRDVGEGRVPTYAVLNFCRALAFIQDKIITSKKEGGKWGIKNLPEEYIVLIQEALNEYAETGTGKLIDLAILKMFANFTKEKIDLESVVK